MLFKVYTSAEWTVLITVNRYFKRFSSVTDLQKFKKQRRRSCEQCFFGTDLWREEVLRLRIGGEHILMSNSARGSDISLFGQGRTPQVSVYFHYLHFYGSQLSALSSSAVK
jgi:hypothetical protein